MDRFNKVIRSLEGLDKKKLELLRKKVRPLAEAFNQEVITFLEDKRYPLRGGDIPPQPPDTREEYDGRTATERLHGNKTLAASQYVRLRKKRGENTLEVRFYNAAPHAQYFFPEISPHPIQARNKPRLAYWAGEPMAWHPPYGSTDEDELPAGLRRPERVSHPGHMSYLIYIIRIWKKRYGPKVSALYKDVVEALGKSMRDDLK